MISISELRKQYGKMTAIHIDELTIHRGERIGLVGNNGAGKTTLISLILDLIQADNGHVSINGIDVAKNESWKSKVTAFLDESFVIDYLTPDEYFQFLGRLRGLSKADIDQRLEQFRDFFNGQIRGYKKYIRDLSKGNKKKVGIGGVLLSYADVIILDEPFANLDPSSQFELQKLVNQLRVEQTIFISSHDLNHISEVCNRIIILENGRLIRDLEKNDDTLIELKQYFAAKSEKDEV